MEFESLIEYTTLAIGVTTSIKLNGEIMENREGTILLSFDMNTIAIGISFGNTR